MKVDMTMCCPKCDGTGQVLDPRSVGHRMREQREKSGMTLREVARRLSLSAPYVSDLERGQRGWSGGLIENYKKALKAG